MKKVTKKVVIKKAVKKVVAKKVAAPKITLTLKQAESIVAFYAKQGKTSKVLVSKIEVAVKQ